ncbi:hypothetical protein ACHAXR_011519 [Thalassiosira sp. AJA248-18]
MTYATTSSSSLLLFDDSIKDNLLQNRHLDNNTLYNETHTITSEPCETSSNITSSVTTFLFFIFPVIGFLVLVMGSFLLRKRQVQQDAEAIRRYHERISAADAERRLNEERRNRLVEKALVTTKVTFSKRISGGGRRLAAFGARGRTSTMETDVTVESGNSNSSVDSDSTISSRRASEVSSIGGSTHEEDGEKELSEAELGQQVTSTLPDNIINESSSETSTKSRSSEAPALENDTTHSLDWETETCAICLEPYKDNDDVSYSKHQNCTHAFHTSCILSWLKDEFRNDCPCCRGPYLHLCVVEDDGEYLGAGTTINRSSSNTDSSTSMSRSMDIAEEMDGTSLDETTNSGVATAGREDSNV